MLLQVRGTNIQPVGYECNKKENERDESGVIADRTGSR